jgi:hypothetical protein
MSDEPKKRSRAWIWWALLALLVLYPLSLGPAFAIADWIVITNPEPRFYYAIVYIYAPLWWVGDYSESARDAREWYIDWWRG